MIDLKNCDTKEIVKYFSRETNNLLFKPNKIAEEQKDSREMKDLDFCWMRTLSRTEYRTDLRNEASARVGRQLTEIPFIRRTMELTSNPKMQEVAENMSREHRTIQQFFSGLIFYHFMLICTEKESKILSDAMGENFYKLPLI